MKKLFPILLAGLAFVVVLFFLLTVLRPAQTKPVVVAAKQITAGHIIAAEDLTTASIPANMIPTDAVTDPASIVGQTASIDRSTGDMIATSQLGEVVRLKPNERAVAIKVSDSAGLAGLLRPGDYVGVVAVIRSMNISSNGTFSKSTIEGLRVLYISPAFKALDPSEPAPTAEPVSGGTMGSSSVADERASEGTIVLAVPTAMQSIVYEFTGVDNLSPVTRTVSAIELLALLDQSDANLSLYLMPGEAQPFRTSGLWMPDLVVTPGLTPTPTATPFGYQGGSASTPTPMGTPMITVTPTPAP